uniref:Uncharacterized protein n=1 Tax=Anopheles darlingi TaxID=43151 RepID=A0A2M4DFL7_ANODA
MVRPRPGGRQTAVALVAPVSCMALSMMPSSPSVAVVLVVPLIAAARRVRHFHRSSSSPVRVVSLIGVFFRHRPKSRQPISSTNPFTNHRRSPPAAWCSMVSTIVTSGMVARVAAAAKTKTKRSRAITRNLKLRAESDGECIRASLRRWKVMLY